MALGKYNRRTVSATSGTVLPGATVSFYNQLTGLPATAYNDPDGLDPIGSSMTSGSQGEVEVFLDPGKYRITVELDDLYEEITYEPVTGDLAVVDAGEVALNFLAAATPAANSIPRILPNGFTELRTVAETKTDLSLNNVDNTSDANKPVSTATQDALDLKLDAAGAVISVYGRTGNVTSQAGDYTTAQISESGNLYFTDVRTLAAIATASQVLTANGTVAAPSYSFTSDPDSGLRTVSDNVVAIATGGGDRITVNNTGLGVGVAPVAPFSVLSSGTTTVASIENNNAAFAATLLLLNTSLSTAGDVFRIRASGVNRFIINGTGTVSLGIWQGTAVAMAYGGHGATTASGARTNLGLNVAVPSGPTATGEVGQTAGDANFIYRCVATDTWIRVPKDATWV